MKRAVVRNMLGEIIDFCDNNYEQWLSIGLTSNKWGEAGSFTISINDIVKIESKAEDNKKKRLGLVRDFDALLPHRQEKLKNRIFKWVLANADINVEDI